MKTYLSLEFLTLEKLLAHLDVDGGARVDGTFQLQSERVGHLRGGLTYKTVSYTHLRAHET